MALFSLLLLHFTEGFGEFFLLLLELLGEAGGILQFGERFVQKLLGLRGGLGGFGEFFRGELLGLTEFLREFTNFFVDGFFGLFQIIDRLALRLARSGGIGFVQILLSFLHLLLGLL